MEDLSHTAPVMYRLERHSIIGQIFHGETTVMHHVYLSQVSTFYNWHAVEFIQFICDLVVLDQSPLFIDDLIFSSEPFFSHKFKSQYHVFRFIISKHISDKQAPL